MVSGRKDRQSIILVKEQIVEMRNISIIKLSVILIALSICTNLLYSQNQSIRLQSITVNDGLSQSHVNTIYEDSRGYMWFGTTDGLNRFDGHEFVVYKYDPDDYNSISDNFVRCIIEDQNKRLWIGTDAGGLNVLDMDTEKFRRVSFKNSTEKSIHNQQIWDLSIDSLSQLWVATWDGLYRIALDESTYSATIASNQTKQIRCLTITQISRYGWVVRMMVYSSTLIRS